MIVSPFGDTIFTCSIPSVYAHSKRILNSFNNRNTNAATESFNAKQKAFRVQFRGVLDINFSSLESQKFLLEKKKEKQERNGDPPNFSREPFSIGLFT